MKFADFSQIKIGDEASLRKKFLDVDVETFSKMSGDYNPLHVDEPFASKTTFRQRVVHGILSAAQVSALIGMKLPGPGALWTEQHFKFLKPVFIGDEVLFVVRVKHRSEATRTLVLELEATNQRNEVVLSGEGKVSILEDHTLEAEAAEAEPVAPPVLVTGSSRGIGAAIVRALAADGFPVIINHRDSLPQAQALAGELREAHSPVLVAKADVTDPVAVKEMCSRAEEAFGQPIGVLVNNASYGINPAALIDSSWEDLERHLSVQLRGALNCVQAVTPAMIQRKSGRIINIGSIVARGAPPAKWAGYAIAKSGLATLTRALAVELGPHGIRTNLVAPGMTETSLIASIPTRQRKLTAMQTPLRRLASGRDIARVVSMLCSEAGDFIHGAEIPVCGGAVM